MRTATISSSVPATRHRPIRASRPPRSRSLSSDSHTKSTQVQYGRPCSTMPYGCLRSYGQSLGIDTYVRGRSFTDVKFRDTFLLTYRSFMTPASLLSQLIARWNIDDDPMDPNVKKTVQLRYGGRVLSLSLALELENADRINGVACNIAVY